MAAPLHECTVAELKATLTQGELKALPRAVVGDAAKNGTDEQNAAAVDSWLADHLRRACDQVVAAVNACEKNPRILCGFSKVPAACVKTALVLARHSIIASIPGSDLSGTLEGSTRASEYSTATRTLEQLAACELAVNDYANSGDEAIDPTTRSGVFIIAHPANCWMI